MRISRSWDGSARCCRWLVAILFLASAAPGWAHLGSPDVFFEGQAGPYPARIVVRPPGVIPGLANVTVRVWSPGVQRVTVLPMRWNTGRQGAPPPDRATLVSGETNLYSTELWFMQGGAQSVEVEIQGAAGSGKAVIPVDAVATRVLAMGPGLGKGLAVCGAILLLLLSAMVGAAVREGALPPGMLPSSSRRWLARGVSVLTALLLSGALVLGKKWWDSEAADYRNNRLYRPLNMVTEVKASPGHQKVWLQIQDEKFDRGAPLVPDHGKLMHLFLIREPGLDVFAHLHPQKIDWRTFEVTLPSLPPGPYSLYADVTLETGFSETLTNRVELQAGSGSSSAEVDSDDAWRVSAPAEGTASDPGQSQSLDRPTGGSCQFTWNPAGPLLVRREADLRFSLRDGAGRPLRLEPYLGMAGHLVLRHVDGSVFTHLHPGGSFSMAAQRLFEMRADGRAPLKVALATNDPICQLPTSAEIERSAGVLLESGSEATVRFFYSFPKEGRYRLWLQTKAEGRILTSVFDVDVRAGNPPEQTSGIAGENLATALPGPRKGTTATAKTSSP